MAKGKYTYEYPRPALTVDLVVVTRGPKPRVLLIRRKNPPFAGCWAVPGGFVDMEETLESAARRELLEETGVRATKLIQLRAFDTIGRDPRERTISIAFLAQVPAAKDAHAGDDAGDVGWFALDRPPPLAFDHRDILAFARKHLKEQHG